MWLYPAVRAPANAHDAAILTCDTNLQKNCFICFNESPLKMVKTAFYFSLTVLFVLKIFKVLSWVFGHVHITDWLQI